MPLPHREVIKTVEADGHKWELERVGTDYVLWHESHGVLQNKIRILPGALRDLGSAMLVEGATNDFRGG